MEPIALREAACIANIAYTLPIYIDYNEFFVAVVVMQVHNSRAEFRYPTMGFGIVILGNSEFQA
jgi:hypothetical protein